jgi:hypothetical protein
MHGIAIARVYNKTNNHIVLFKIYNRKSIYLSCLVGCDVLGSTLRGSEPTRLALSLTNLEGWPMLEEL